MTAKRWIVRRQETERAASLARDLGISPTVAALLLSRGCGDDRSARQPPQRVQAIPRVLLEEAHRCVERRAAPHLQAE